MNAIHLFYAAKLQLKSGKKYENILFCLAHVLARIRRATFRLSRPITAPK